VGLGSGQAWGGVVQTCPTVAILSLHSPRAPWRQHKSLSAFPLPSEHCQRQCRLPSAVWHCGVRPSLKEQLHHSHNATQHRGVQHLVRSVDLGLVLDQQLHNRLTAILDS